MIGTRMTDTRSKLIDAALSLFSDRGYAGVSIGAIEAAAGLAPRAGGFYRHFESKESLLLAIAKERIIEQSDELGFDDVFPLHNTQAELLVIARAYLQANKRQKKYRRLIQDVRNQPEIAKFEQRANRELFAQLRDWVASKPAASNLKKPALSAFTMTVFGGILFYTAKKFDGISIPGLSDETLTENWAEYWARVLDKPRKRQPVAKPRT